MTAFRYRAMTPAGRLVSGLYEAPTEAAVFRYVRSAGNFPLSAKESGRSLLRLLPARNKRPPLRVLARATQELAALISAGVELDRALGLLANLDGLGPLKLSFANIRARVRDGASFAEALVREDGFPGFYVSTVRAGEHGGALDSALTRLADYLARTMAVRETITSALIYPCILVATAFGAIAFILLFVLPQFEPLFAEAGRRLPVSTRIVIAAGHGLARYGWIAALCAVAMSIWARLLLKRVENRRVFHGWLLRLPLLGALIAAAQLERFCRTLGTLLGNGVPLPSALAIAAGAVTNESIAGRLRETASRLREGERLSDRLQRIGIFPSAAFDLIRIGEETGKLDVMLLRQADLDAQRLKHTIDRLLALLVPALTVLLGMIVAGLIASMLVALLSVNDLAL